MMNKISAMLRAALLLAFLAFFTSASIATDKVTLKDGRVLEGTITRQVDGIIWLKYEQSGIAQETMFRPDEINKVEHDGAVGTPAAVSAAPVVANTDTKPAAPKIGVPKGVVLTLGDEENGDMVGIYLTAH